MTFSESEVNQEYQKAIEFATSHYENFPVVSFLISKKLKKHVAIIYKFARQADDIADEGSYSKEERLNRLNEYESNLNDAIAGNYKNPFWQALSKTILDLNLTPTLFNDLLIAFKRDVIKHQYKDFEEILDYCKYSANPIGRLILELRGIFNEKSKNKSDSICTALQLTNFYQDLGLDFLKGRIYIPVEEMQNFGISEIDFEKKQINSNFKKLIKLQVERARELFTIGYSLIDQLPLKLAIEIKWTILGGEEILKKIEQLDYDVFTIRPVLNKKDFIRLLLRSFKRLNAR